jgi:hypothetical protein
MTSLPLAPQGVKCGTGTADNRSNKANLPPRVRIPEDKTSDIEGERGQIEYEMAAAVSDIEAIDPRNSKR